MLTTPSTRPAPAIPANQASPRARRARRRIVPVPVFVSVAIVILATAGRTYRPGVPCAPCVYQRTHNTPGRFPAIALAKAPTAPIEPSSMRAADGTADL